MIADIWTVMSKEWREYVTMRGSSRTGPLGLLVFASFVGIVLPLQLGHVWVDSPVALISAFWVPLVLVLSVIGDAIAGERERHTLETLLATRLSDSAILLGKVAAAVAYGTGLTLVSDLAALVVVNLADWQGRLLLYSPAIASGIVALSLLGSGLIAGVGVLVSLRSATVREAQQRLSIAMMVIFFGLLLGLQLLPRALVTRLGLYLEGEGAMRTLALALLVLLIIDAALLLAALRCFRRPRLILD